MAHEHPVPSDPLRFIQGCVEQSRILWTYHVNIRLKGRFIPRQAIIESYASYEIIEQYPKDKYLPSYLIRSEFQGDVFHILIAIDMQEDNIRIVTTYRPDSEEWEDGLRIRRCSS